MVAVRSGSREQAFLAEIIPVVMSVHVRKDLIVLQEWNRSARAEIEVPRIESRMSDPDRVAEVAGITEQMACRNSGRIGTRECRKQRVTVLEVHALSSDSPERRRVLSVDRAVPHAVSDEHNHVSTWRVARFALCGRG